MRALARFVFLLVLLAGIGLGFVYPWLVRSAPGEEIGRWHAYNPLNGFRQVEVGLDEEHAPVLVEVVLISSGPRAAPIQGAVLTLTASTRRRTVLAAALSFDERPGALASPQSGETIYRDSAGEISEIESGPYLFTLEPGDVEGIDIISADLILTSRAFAVDPRAQPVSFVLMAVGFIGLVLSFRRGKPRNPNSQPPKPRWGRAGAERR